MADEGGYRITAEIRDKVIFAAHNLLSDPPFKKLDFLSCRNLLIYFRPESQKKILPWFHYALNRSGVLLLGRSESIGGYEHIFAPIEKKHASSAATTSRCHCAAFAARWKPSCGPRRDGGGPDFRYGTKPYAALRSGRACRRSVP